MELLSNGNFNVDLHELRQRVLVSVAAIIVGSTFAYLFRVELADFMVAPLFTAYPDLATLIYTNLTEALFGYLKLAILVGIIVSFPIICYQGWMFIGPGLRKSEKKTAFLVVFFATLLFVGGATFAFFVVLPKALGFLMGFASQELQPKPKFGLYLTFVARSCLAFGLSFEIPFLMVVAAKIGWVERERFTKQRVHFYLAIIVLSFLLTAGDILSAVLLAFPLCGLYEAGILVMFIFLRGKKS